MIAYLAEISNGDTSVAPGSVELRLDGALVSPAPNVTATAGGATVSFQAPGLMAAGSTHTYGLSYRDTGTPPATYTHTVQYTVHSSR